MYNIQFKERNRNQADKSQSSQVILQQNKKKNFGDTARFMGSHTRAASDSVTHKRGSAGAHSSFFGTITGVRSLSLSSSVMSTIGIYTLPSCQPTRKEYREQRVGDDVSRGAALYTYMYCTYLYTHLSCTPICIYNIIPVYLFRIARGQDRDLEPIYIT